MKQIFFTKYKSLIGLLGLIVACLVLFAVTPDLAAQESSVREGLSATGADTTQGAAQSGIYGLIENVINLFSIVVGIISVIMIIIGGLKYVASTGDAQKVDSAKNTILYAIIGLVIVAFAQVIVLFVFDSVT